MICWLKYTLMITVRNIRWQMEYYWHIVRTLTTWRFHGASWYFPSAAMALHGTSVLMRRGIAMVCRGASCNVSARSRHSSVECIYLYSKASRGLETSCREWRRKRSSLRILFTDVLGNRFWSICMCCINSERASAFPCGEAQLWWIRHLGRLDRYGVRNRHPFRFDW